MLQRIIEVSQVAVILSFVLPALEVSDVLAVHVLLPIFDVHHHDLTWLLTPCGPVASKKADVFAGDVLTFLLLAEHKIFVDQSVADQRCKLGNHVIDLSHDASWQDGEDHKLVVLAQLGQLLHQLIRPERYPGYADYAFNRTLELFGGRVGVAELNTERVNKLNK